MDTTPYHEYVEHLEGSLKPFAKKSFEADSPNFLNGQEMRKYFQDAWKTQAGQLKLSNRTPLQLERDRILYSGSLRKQTEKYHVLHSGFRRVIRNYATHTMRMAHVTRAICKALGLNSDFAEAIALGAKVGAAPFIHVSKNVAGDWLQKKISDISEREAARNSNQADIQQVQLQLFPSAGAGLPAWVSNLKSRDVLEQVVKHVPCATGENVDAPYSSGQESYWLLCTNPYLREPGRSLYAAETMYGIWRHSRRVRPKKESFFHRWSAGSSVHKITWQHSTYEGVVVQYSDDITWIIENLNDANDAAILGGAKKNLFLQLKNYISDTAAFELKQALVDADAGALYTYFISDFVERAKEVLSRSDRDARTGLREGRVEAMIGPSAEAEVVLDKMEEYLRSNVFGESRIRNRNRMLESVSQVCLDLLYDTKELVLTRLVEDRANLENWADDKRTMASELLSNDVHRAQLAIDIFSSMGDQEIFEFVGIQSF